MKKAFIVVKRINKEIKYCFEKFWIKNKKLYGLRPSRNIKICT